ncbi:MAG: hypothetical protein HC915_00125 [Anaerolineae bacterium]|nr:hypothetical protein [Anaerolineae bacterium]
MSTVRLIEESSTDGGVVQTIAFELRGAGLTALLQATQPATATLSGAVAEGLSPESLARYVVAVDLEGRLLSGSVQLELHSEATLEDGSVLRLRLEHSQEALYSEINQPQDPIEAP